MDDTKKLIEKYKRELMELSRNAPPSPQSGRPAETRPAETRSAENRSTANRPETSERPADSRSSDNRSAENRSAEKPAKPPKVIGYVTEENGDFQSVFDRYITEAVENNEIETVRTEDPDYLNMPNGTDIPDDEPSTQQNGSPRSTSPRSTVKAPDMASARRNTEAMPRELPRDSLDNSYRPNPEDNMDQGTGKTISDFPVPEYADLAEFETRNNCGGTLQFHVFAAREALPIENASISVSTRINGKSYEMFSMLTNSSGETGAQTLPAPSRDLSQSSENNVQPFALYDASVEKAGYARVILRDIPIFDGVMSIQRVAMIPEIDFTSANRPNEEITEVRDAD